MESAYRTDPNALMPNWPVTRYRVEDGDGEPAGFNRGEQMPADMQRVNEGDF